ncbi:hypothetical protein KSD_57500 [Ktedonobacter sp. SOSP1-85]|uniref:AAA family ATPase n=1 Tax=Ktedonobacter sp. SOSP1-85 TaxID=2778367 RepID=UPI0019150B66|nr:AAA family ATPase [Ktedonobacter sp. SOSP1-85]GHO77979.1 hypothetical protein KSD_57500 [Ktedonobacter sp. SOSP1-85]
MPITSCKDFITFQPYQPKYPWPIENLLAPGLTLLTGAPRSGKTSLAYQLMQHVAHGTHAFGQSEQFHTRQHSVLYLALDTPTTGLVQLHERYSASHSGQSPSERCHLTNTWSPLTEREGLQDLETWLSVHMDARLLVIDNLAALRTLFKGNDRELLGILRRLAERLQIGILLLHTCTSSSPLVAHVDHHLHLKRLKTPSYYRLDVLGTLLKPASHLLYCPVDAMQFQLAEPEDTFAIETLNAPKALSPERLTILRLFHEQATPLTPAQITSTLAMSPVNVRQLLHSMTSSYMLTSPSYGHYALAPSIVPLLPELLEHHVTIGKKANAHTSPAADTTPEPFSTAPDALTSLTDIHANTIHHTSTAFPNKQSASKVSPPQPPIITNTQHNPPASPSHFGFIQLNRAQRRALKHWG